MDAIAKPFDEVTAALQRFGAAPELRVLHVTTSTPLRLGVLARVAQAEGRAGNTRPFFVLESPTEPDDDGWESRREELRADYDKLRDEAAGEGLTLAPLPDPADGGALVRFVRDVKEVSHALRPPLDGLVLVLAPVWVRDPARWTQDLTALLTGRLLEQVRLVIVDVEEPVAEPVLRDMGAAADFVEARLDEEGASADMDKMVAAMASAPAGATGARLMGAAGPRVTPPPRRRAAPLDEKAVEALAAETGVPKALLTPEVPHALRVLVLEAAQAMRKEDAPTAIRKQREARDLCAASALSRETVVMELVLGGYALQAGRATAAAEVFAEARDRAASQKMPELAAQAELARASALLVAGQTDAAAVVYADAGALAETAGVALLAIEGYRMAGQLLLSHGQDRQAIATWKRALEVADAAPPEQQDASTAGEVARALAAVCRRHGLQEQARALDEQAAAYEAPPVQGSA